MATMTATSNSAKQPEFSIAEARAIVKDLFEPKPWIYWTDFLGSTAVGCLGFFVLMQSPQRWVVVLGYCLTVLAFYRTVLFTHELVHLKSPAFVPFRIVWNVLCGIPLMIPSYMYYTHVEHHARKHYGTRADGEYLPLSTTSIWHIVWYMVQPLFIPFLGFIRFSIMAPLGWLIPPFRRWLHVHASAMIMDPAYLRPMPTAAELKVWYLQEAACFVYMTTVAIGYATGRLPAGQLWHVYFIALGIITINQLRTLGAHRFLYPGDRELTFVEQLLDSVNYPERPWLTGLWAPVGLRYHALHHLFPALPYHALDEAHWRLMAQLPADSPYRQTNSPSLIVALKELIVRSWNRKKQPPVDALPPTSVTA